MSPAFTDADVGKLVESADGQEVGSVASVDGETAYVESSPGETAAISAAVGRESEGDDVVVLPAEAVARVTDTAVELNASIPSDPVAGGAAGSERPADRPAAAPGDDTVAGSEEDVAGAIDGDDERRRSRELDPLGEMDPAGEMDATGESGGVEELYPPEERSDTDEREWLDAGTERGTDPSAPGGRAPSVERTPEEGVDRTDAGSVPTGETSTPGTSEEAESGTDRPDPDQNDDRTE